MELEEFLTQYHDLCLDLTECENKLYELEFPARGNRIVTGEHAGISNQPEEYAVLRDKLERKIGYLKSQINKSKKRIEAFLHRLHPRHAKLLRKKYLEGLNTKELASWMHVQEKTANAAIKAALEKARPEYEKFITKGKNEA